MIQLPSGEKVPLNTIADYSIGEGFSSIRRIDQRRVINITADADKSKANLELIRADLMGNKNELGSIDKILRLIPISNGRLKERLESNRISLVVLSKRPYWHCLLFTLYLPFLEILYPTNHCYVSDSLWYDWCNRRPFYPQSTSEYFIILGFVALTGLLLMTVCHD